MGRIGIAAWDIAGARARFCLRHLQDAAGLGGGHLLTVFPEARQAFWEVLDVMPCHVGGVRTLPRSARTRERIPKMV